MDRSKLLLGLGAAVSVVGFAGERRASACGGCFHPPTQTVTDITDERMLLTVSAAQSTLYDQIEYSGSPTSFAWVLPIRGVVTVGLSADVLFDSIDAVTATHIQPPPQNCPTPPGCGGFRGAAGLAPAAPGGGGFGGFQSNSPPPPVQVLKQANVGPYATVQLHSTDSSALDAWLTQNGYNIPAAVQPILDAYVSEGFDFLAMKLLPNQGVQAMRPVRVTTPGASLSLPMRMASIGTGAVTGITIWVVADGRYEPQNFQFFHIDDSQLVWDWSSNISNYSTLRVQRESMLKNAGWEIESSIAVNEQVIKNVVMSGGQYNGNGGLGTSGAPIDATQDYLPVGDAEAGAGDGGYESAEQVRDDDINTLFSGLTGSTVRITRIRSDIAQAAMTADFVLQAAADQSELSNVRNVTQSVNLTCPIYSGNGCQIIGMGTLAQAQASIDGGASAGGTTIVGQVPQPSGTVASGSNASAAGGGGSGCATAPQRGKSGLAFGALAGLLGLTAFGAIRVRRRRARSRD
jgi:MYXO-CTERM domain-containing protein